MSKSESTKKAKTRTTCLCDCKSLSFYFGINSEIWILDSNSWVAKNMNGGGMGGGGKKYELPYIPRKVEQGDMEEKVRY